MNKKLLIGIVIILIIFAPLLIIYTYNFIAEKQRESIRYCVVDEDCILQSYDSSICSRWLGCFNKNEKPMSNILSLSAFCDYPPSSCKCENRECR